MIRKSKGVARVNGADLYFELTGDGRPLVLLHAGICDGRMWDGQFDALARRYRVLRYDRRGFGQTTQGAEVFSHVEDLAGLLSHFDLGRVTLVGCSQGAKIALDYALKNVTQVAALVLVSPAVSGLKYRAEFPPRQVRALEEAEGSGDAARVNEVELQIWVDGPHRAPGDVDPAVRGLVAEMNLAALGASAGEEVPSGINAAERLGEVRVPTFVVAGDLDTPRTLEAAEALASGIPGARLVVMEGAAHLPNMERPEKFNRLVLEFLSGSAAVGGRV